jgi:spore coat polysaccharide biosynthesis protein SpsF
VDHSHYRWTLDTEDDWRLLVRIFDRLDGDGAYFPTSRVVELIRREPDLAEINAHVTQKTIDH